VPVLEGTQCQFWKAPSASFGKSRLLRFDPPHRLQIGAAGQDLMNNSPLECKVLIAPSCWISLSQGRGGQRSCPITPRHRIAQQGSAKGLLGLRRSQWVQTLESTDALSAHACGRTATQSRLGGEPFVRREVSGGLGPSVMIGPERGKIRDHFATLWSVSTPGLCVDITEYLN